MRLDCKHLSASLLAIPLLLVFAGIGCAERHYYRVYDPYYTDYHVWNHEEIVHYRQWSSETGRDANRDFRRLAPEEQKQYWTRRHNHGDREQDRSRDHRDQDDR